MVLGVVHMTRALSSLRIHWDFPELGLNCCTLGSASDPGHIKNRLFSLGLSACFGGAISKVLGCMTHAPSSVRIHWISESWELDCCTPGPTNDPEHTEQ